MSYLVGMDDTDSRSGHCTTHLGYLVVCELARLGCTFPRYPRLVRLNPNIPFKTRGNAAVCIEFEAGSEVIRERAFSATERLLEEEADVENGANAGLVMVSKEEVPGLFRQVYQEAISGLVNYRRVIRAVEEMGVRHKFLGNGMGIVGAVASLGFSDTEDHTYELIAYRRPENCGTFRELERESVVRMEAETFPHTFNSYDHESGRVLISPTGPDPVFLGVRGDSPRAVLDAFRRLRVREEPLGYVVYATNQSTDAHLANRLRLPLKAFSAGWLEGSVSSVRPSRGGHLLLELHAGGYTIPCMVYEPSGDLSRLARLLRPGDSVMLAGGVRRASSKHPAVVNVERIDVLSLSPRGRVTNPRCAACGSGTKSEGRGKGYQCKRCGLKWEGPKSRRVHPAPPRLLPGTYLPSPRAQRHLTKQLIRYGNEPVGTHGLVDGWLVPPRMELKLR